MGKEIVTKLDAAKRQMHEAIRLLFEGRDPVSIHTLAAAAAQVLADLCNSRGVGMPLRNGDRIREERRREWLQAMKASENFFKHADRDPDESHDFNREATHFVLLDAVTMYAALTSRFTDEAGVFQSWFFLKYPDLLLDCEWKKTLLEHSARLRVDPNDLGFFERAIRGKTLLGTNALKGFD